MSRWGLTLCLLLPACGGTTTSGTASASGGSSSASGGSSGTGGKEPQVHRAAPAPCPAPPTPPNGSAVPDPQSNRPCASDADCFGAFNGRCTQQRTGRECVYDNCYSDDQCTGGAVCECREATSGGNACLSSGCRVNADCPGGWCSPTLGTCGSFMGIVGYECHTLQDECTDDTDCMSPGMGTGYCMHSPEVGHWVCSFSQCAG